MELILKCCCLLNTEKANYLSWSHSCHVSTICNDQCYFKGSVISYSLDFSLMNATLSFPLFLLPFSGSKIEGCFVGKEKYLSRLLCNTFMYPTHLSCSPWRKPTILFNWNSVDTYKENTSSRTNAIHITEKVKLKEWVKLSLALLWRIYGLQSWLFYCLIFVNRTFLLSHKEFPPRRSAQWASYCSRFYGNHVVWGTRATTDPS